MTIHQKITVAVAACLLCAPGTGSARDKDKHNDDNTAERVEIKYVVPEKDIEAVSKRLNLDMDHPTEMRVVCFYDTKSQELFQHSPRVILRSRCTTGLEKPETDTTVKIRGKRVEREKVECESDLVIGKPKPVPSCSLTDKTQGKGEIENANEGKDVKKIFDHAQEKFVEEGGIKDLDWDKLVPFGPVNDVKVWKHLPAEGLKGITVERWELPKTDGKPQRVLFEVSTKAPMSAVRQASATFKKLMGIEQVDTQQESETKTKLVMDHFSKEPPISR